MEHYYRVEIYNYDEEKTIGGLMSAIVALIAKKEGIKPDIPQDELAKVFANSKKTEVKELLGILNVLMQGVPYPEAYLKDKENRICLFTEADFAQKRLFLELLNAHVENEMPDCEIVYCDFELPPEVILYKDEHQIVISLDTYKEYHSGIYYAAFEEDE